MPSVSEEGYPAGVAGALGWHGYGGPLRPGRAPSESGQRIELLYGRPLQGPPPEEIIARCDVNPSLLGLEVAVLREHGAVLRRTPVADIVAAIDRAVAEWGDAARPGYDEDVRRLAEATGYHPAMVRPALADLSHAFRAPALERLLRRELGNPAVLDRFVPRVDGGMTRAYGPGVTVIVLSGNVFHVAAESIVLALLAKSACLVKASARDPLFPALFARSLTRDERLGWLGAALMVVRWPGGDEALERAAFAAADAVVAYGGSEAVEAVRARTPAGTRFIAHGPKISFAVVAETQAADEQTAHAAAHDVSFFDQQGCVSPHTIYIEGGASVARRFAELLAKAMEDYARRYPRSALTAAEAAGVQQARGAAEFRPDAEVFADDAGTAWTVIVDPDPGFGVSCLNRVVYVKPLASLDRLPELLEPVRSYLQTAGVAGDKAFHMALAEAVAPLGVCRMCPLGQMQHPPADWRHDGRPRLLDLLRWTDVEAPEASAHAPDA